jgi:aspartate dehydrogenase
VTRTVGLLGAGALGGVLRERLAAGDVAGCRLGPVRTRGQVVGLGGADVVVESAGVAAAVAEVPALLAAGVDVVLCSCGALADPDMVRALARLVPGRARLLLPAGAIGGLDIFRAAVRGSTSARVRLHTTKRAAALDSLSAGPVTVFAGSARGAALAFPRTSNVAVALAVATVGLDRTEVLVTADPGAVTSRHVARVETELGEYRLEASNAVAPGSGGRTSAVTAWSVLTLLEDLARGHAGGLLVPLGAAPAPL